MAGDAPSGTAYSADAPPRPRSLLWTIVPAVCGMPLIGLAVLILLPPLRIGLDDARAPRSVVPAQQTAATAPGPVPASPRPDTPVDDGGMQRPASPGVPLAALGSEPTEAEAMPPGSRTYASSQAPAEAVAPEVAPEVAPPGTSIPLPGTSDRAHGDIASSAATPPPAVQPGIAAIVPSARDGDAVAAATPAGPAAGDDDAPSPGPEAAPLRLAAVSPPLPRAPASTRAQPPAATPNKAAGFGALATAEPSLDSRCRATLVRLQLEAAPGQADLGFLRRSCTPDRR